MKLITSLALAAALGISLTACVKNNDDSAVVSANISEDANQFKVDRRTVFYNGITGEYLLSVEGKCSITKDNTDNQLELLCKTGPNEYKKHFLGLSDNVTYFSEQLNPVTTSAYHYKVQFKPAAIIPDVQIRLKQEGEL